MGMLLPRNKARFEPEVKEVVENVADEAVLVANSDEAEKLNTTEDLENEEPSTSSQEDSEEPEALTDDLETVAIEAPKDDVPTMLSKKDDIKAWLDAQGVTYTNDLTKAQLLDLMPVTE